MFIGLDSVIKKADEKKYMKVIPTIPLEEVIKAQVETLKKDPHYSKCSEAELKDIVLSMRATNLNKNLSDSIRSLYDLDGKPFDSFWSQFSYEEILGMADEGANVPQEFLDWANAMADSDTTAYEIATDGSSDDSTLTSLELETDESTELGQQKKLQKYTSKADLQEELLQDKSDELQIQNNDLIATQNELKINQKMSIEKIDQISKEFAVLDNKVKSGEQLDEKELQKFKEYGVILNTTSQELIAQSKNVEAELNDFVAQVDEVNSIIDINNSISSTIDSLSLSFAEFEGSKRYSFTQSNAVVASFGSMAGYAYAAQGQSIAVTAGIIGVKLDFETEDLQYKLRANQDVEEDTRNQIAKINNTKTLNVSNKSNIQNVANNSEEEIGNDGEEIPNLPQDTQNENDNVPPTSGQTNNNENPIQDIEMTLDGENTGENLLQTPENQEQQNDAPDIAAAGLTLVPGDEATSPVDNNVNDEEKDENTQVENSENTQAQDTNVALMNSYVSEASAKSSDMQTQVQNLNYMSDQVRGLRDNQEQDVNQITADLNLRISAFENLLNSFRSANELTAADIANYDRLRTDLDGVLVNDIQSRMSVLNEFSSVVQTGLAASEANINYANSAVAFGNEYLTTNAENENTNADLANESISAGTSLLDQAQAARRQFTLSESLNNFSTQYSAQLGSILNTSNSRINTINDEFGALIASKYNTGNVDNNLDNNQLPEIPENNVDNTVLRSSEVPAGEEFRSQNENDKIANKNATISPAMNMSSESDLANEQIRSLASQANVLYSEEQDLVASSSLNESVAENTYEDASVSEVGNANNSDDIENKVSSLDSLTQDAVRIRENTEKNQNNRNNTQAQAQIDISPVEGILADAQDVDNTLTTKSEYEVPQNPEKNERNVKETETEAEVLAVEDAEDSISSDIGNDILSTVSLDVDANAVDKAFPDMIAPRVSPATRDDTENASVVGLEEAIDDAGEDSSEQIAADLANKIAQDVSKNVMKDSIREVAKNSFYDVVDRVQQKDVKEDKRRRVLVEFERKKRDEIRKGVEKIKNTQRMK